MKRRPYWLPSYAASCALLVLCGCKAVTRELPRPAPAVTQRHFAKGENSLRRVAVMPFVSNLSVTRSRDETEKSRGEAAELVTRFFTDALMATGVPVVAAADLQIAFEAEGMIAPGSDAQRAARVASRHFGATSVVIGELLRFRDRVGESMGSMRPASVALQITLHEAPSGFKLWTARFDETQQPLSDNVFNAGRYPGGGSRWLSSTEMARWGVEEAARALANRP